MNKLAFILGIIAGILVGILITPTVKATEIGNPYETDTIVYIFDAQEQMDMEKYFELYCHEIDSLVYSYGMEIDADRVDIENDTQMEQAAYELLGDKFYTWRQRESKYAWIRDVFIARYCY